jgi:hypothetical protein
MITSREARGPRQTKGGTPMALALTVEKLDGLDPAVAALYVEKEGIFHLDVTGLEDTAGLKSALEAERKTRKDFEKKYGALKDVDPEEYARLKAEAAERETKKLTEAGEFDKLREKWAKEQADKDAEWERKVAEKDALLATHVKDSQVRNAALKAGVIPEDIEDVMIITARHFKLADDGALQVLDDRGEVTPKTAEEFFTKDFKEKKPKFYAATGSSGGGTAGGGGGGAGGIKTEVQLLQEHYDAAVKARDNVKMVSLKRQIHEAQQKAANG